MNDLSQRLFEFAVKTIKFLKKIPYDTENKVIRYQLAKSATSSGANYEEARAGSSKADFIYKVELALKEMRESNYWLRIIKETNSMDNNLINELEQLISESDELKKILGKTVVTSRKNL
nr:four helix bundle protein [uncultured Carboxylicivirga sp.]